MLPCGHFAPTPACIAPPAPLPPQAANITEALANPEVPLTVLAPTNDAFASALAALNLTAEAVLGDRELLTSILA